MKRYRNVLKMVLAIVFGFALCWLPVNAVFFFSFPCTGKNSPMVLWLCSVPLHCSFYVPCKLRRKPYHMFRVQCQLSSAP